MDHRGPQEHLHIRAQQRPNPGGVLHNAHQVVIFWDAVVDVIAGLKHLRVLKQIGDQVPHAGSVFFSCHRLSIALRRSGVMMRFVSFGLAE